LNWFAENDLLNWFAQKRFVELVCRKQFIKFLRKKCLIGSQKTICGIGLQKTLYCEHDSIIFLKSVKRILKIKASQGLLASGLFQAYGS
jgi:hypothetical protein